MWLHAILVLLAFVFISFVAAQTTIFSPVCVASDPTRNVLELTGSNYSSTSFNITSTIDNCHIYIHDLTVSSIEVYSSVINNSNITIRNVSSSNNSVATFIRFVNPITDFSFINISNVSHSSLSINAATGNDLISIIKFEKAITGKSEMTSWMNISGLEMNDVSCDRTSATSASCSCGMIYFASSVSNVASLRISNSTMKNVSMISSSSIVSYLSAANFNDTLASVRKISIHTFLVRNIQVKNKIGFCQSRIINFKSNVSSGDVEQKFVDTSQILSVRDMSICNFNSSTVGGRSDVRLVHVELDLINYTSVLFRNLSAVSLNSTSTLAESFVYLVSFGSSIFLSAAASSSTLTVDNIQLQRVESTARSNSLLYLLYVIKSVTNYERIQITNATGVSLNSTSTTGASYLCGIIVQSSVSSSTPTSSLIVNSVLWQSVSSTGRASSVLFFFYITGAVSNYSTIRVTNFHASSLCATSAAGGSSHYLVNFGSAVKARLDVDDSFSPSSSLVVDNINVRSASSAGNLSAQMWIFFVNGALENFFSIQIANISAMSLRSTSLSGRSTLYLVGFGSTVQASSESPFSSSSLSFNNILLDSVESTGFADTQLFLYYVNGAVSNYCSVQIKNIAAASLKATSSAGRASLYVVVILSTVSSAARSKDATRLLVDNIRTHEVSAASSGGESQVWIFVVHGAVSNFSIINFSNLAAESLNSSSSSGISTLYFVNFRSSITAPSVEVGNDSINTSLQIENILLQNASSNGMSYANLWIFSTVGFTANYRTILFANLRASSLNAVCLSGTSLFALMNLGSSVTLPGISSSALSTSFRVNNIQLQNVSSFSSQGSSQLWLFSAVGSIRNYNSIQITNVNASSLNSNSVSSRSYIYLLRFGTMIFPSSSASSMLLVDSIQLQNATSVGNLISQMWFIAITGTVSNLSAMQIKNLEAASLNSTAISGGSYIFIVMCFSWVTAMVSSSSSSLLVVESIRVQSSSSVGSTISQMFFCFVGGAANFNNINIRNIATGGVVTSSTTDVSSTLVVYLGGLLNCSCLNIDNIQMQNVAAMSSDASLSISLLFFVSGGTFNNISKISLQNSGIEKISTSSKKVSIIRMLTFDAGTNLQAGTIIINNNSLVLSESASMLSTSQSISAAVVGLAFASPGFSKMDVSNNTLSLTGQYWNQLCSPVKCSIVQVNDVQFGNNNTDTTASVILIRGSAIVPTKSSFISFANYSNTSSTSKNVSLLNFILENNCANFVDSTLVSTSLLGFESPPAPSSPFPSLVFIEVKCNKWPRIVDRTFEKNLLSIASSPSQLSNFIAWTCTVNSRSESSSPSSVETSSSSNSPSIEASLSSSLTSIRTNTNTSDESRTIAASFSSSPQRTGSASAHTRSDSGSRYWNPSPFILKISEPVNSALLVSDVTQATAMLTVAVFSSAAGSPALGFTIGRQQAMMDFAQKSLRGDCRGLLPATTIENVENEVSNPLGLGNSPTQLSIGGSEKLMSYYVGAVVGNCLLIVCLVGANQGIGMGATTFLRVRTNRIINFVKKNKIASMMKERCGGFRRRNEPLMKLIRRVFARSYVSLTLFFCLSFLLTPTLSSALIVLVAAKNDAALEGQQVSGYLKLVSIVCALIFSLVALYFVIWSVKLRRKRKEKYRSLKELDLESWRTEHRTLASWLLKARGEWRYPPISNSATSEIGNGQKTKSKEARKYKKHYEDFLIAEPAFESYRSSIWFSIAEVATAILVAFPPFFAQFASSAKSSCMIQGIMLLIILLVYTTMLIWKNPFKLRILRITNPILSLQQLVIVTMSLVFVATRNGNNDETPAWFWKIILIPLGFESLMSVMMIGVGVFPILMFLKKLKGRAQRIEANNNEDSIRKVEEDKKEERRKLWRSQDDCLESPILAGDIELSQQI